MDPDGNWVNVAIGALVGLVVQGASDIYNGELSGWKSYGTAIVAGGVAGATFGAGTVALGAAGAGESVAGGYVVAAVAGATGGTTARVLNGEDVTAGTVAVDATFGVLGQAAGRAVGQAVTGKINNLSNNAKGKLGEAMTSAKYRLMGYKELGKKQIRTGVRTPTGRIAKAHIDHEFEHFLTGRKSIVESKFNTSGYTKNQAAVLRNDPNAFSTQKWNGEQIGGWATDTTRNAFIYRSKE